MPGLERTERFNMLLTKEEDEMLRALAAHRGLTASDLLRQLLRAAFDAEPAFKRKKKR